MHSRPACYLNEIRFSAGPSGQIRLRQEGCLKLRLPRPADPGWLEAMALNNSGGVVGGDTLLTQLRLTAGARLCFTTASAEKVYGSDPHTSPAVICNAVEVESGAMAEWLPLETILFDGCGLVREFSADLAAGASLLGTEMVVLGRIASGEILRQVRVSDLIRIRREGRLVLHDVWRPPQDICSVASNRATLASARATAMLFHVAPHAEAGIEGARAILARYPALDGGASAWDGMMLVRMLAAEPGLLRAALTEMLHVLRDGRMLPRLWPC